MNYQQTLDFLFSRLPMFSKTGASAYKAGLENIEAICEHLGHPQKKYPSVHIAGTNGKGSVSHMLAAVLQTAGYKTGLHTSPHLKDFRERLKVNGEMVSEQFVIDFTEKIIPLIDKINPSFFEISVAMAFAWFAEQQVDIAVIETGMGGRLDSTNILLPELSIITNISKDHMPLLGDTLAAIAAEKAGIIKQGVPVIVGEALPETKPVFAEAAGKRKAPLLIATEQMQVAGWEWLGHRLHVEVAAARQADHTKWVLDLTGIYQTKNLLTVLAACHQLQQQGWHIENKHIYAALQEVKKLTGLHGRWEQVHTHPDVFIDVAHNEAGIAQLLQQVEVTDHHHLHLIIGMVADKEIDAVLSMLPATATYYFTQAYIPRALPADMLKEKAALKGLTGKIYPDVNTAIREAVSAAHEDDLIVVCGSVFLAAEVLLLQ